MVGMKSVLTYFNRSCRNDLTFGRHRQLFNRCCNRMKIIGKKKVSNQWVDTTT